jgi:hypothetical protein
VIAGYDVSCPRSALNRRNSSKAGRENTASTANPPPSGRRSSPTIVVSEPCRSITYRDSAARSAGAHETMVSFGATADWTSSGRGASASSVRVCACIVRPR